MALSDLASLGHLSQRERQVFVRLKQETLGSPSGRAVSEAD